MRKFISIILTAIILISAIPVSASETDNSFIDIAATAITELALTGVDYPPNAGEKCGEHLNCTIPSGAHCKIAETAWYNETADSLMETDDIFEQGCAYSFGINIVADDGYEFDSYMSVTINGLDDIIDMDASFIYGDEAGHSGLILWTVRYKIPGNRTLRDADITVYYPPKAGEKLGGHYGTDVPRDSHYYVEEYHWYNETEDREMTPDEIFVLGNTYYAELLIMPEEGFEFADKVNVTFNGTASYVDDSYTKVDDNGQKLYARTKKYEVSEVAVLYVDKVEINEFITQPVVGRTAKEFYGFSIPVNSNYSVQAVTWYDVTVSKSMNDDDVFAAGHLYRFNIEIVPDDGYKFADNLVMLLNGGTDYDPEFSGSRENFAVMFSYNRFSVTEDGVILADVNGDGKVNTADAVLILKKAAEMIQFDEKQTFAGDTNKDGAVNTADAVLVLKYAAGMIKGF